MKRGKNIVETVVHALFLLFGLVAVGCVLVITVYLVISGIPAIGRSAWYPSCLGRRGRPQRRSRSTASCRSS